MKLFKKVKTITSRTGVVHFERWAIVETSLFAWYLHKIQKEDQDHMHSHPWSFISLILKGAYIEELRKDPDSQKTIFNIKSPGTFGYFSKNWFHSIRTVVWSPVWTTVFVWRGSFEGDKWKYIVDDDTGGKYIIPFDVYREYKTEAKKEGVKFISYLRRNMVAFQYWEA